MQINIGIGINQRKEIADLLARLLADTYVLYAKTQNFHWNVTGPQFHSLHKMFEEQYLQLALAVDEIAERIRALGFVAPAGLSKFSELSELKDVSGEIAASQMINELLHDHEVIIRNAHKIFTVASELSDEVTEGLISERLTEQEKTAWMLRSSKF